MTSRTITLASIALISTIIVVIICDNWLYIFGLDLYVFEYLIVLLGFDSTINIICANLQYQHGKELYQILNCATLDAQTQKCIVWCYRKNWQCLYQTISLSGACCDRRSVHICVCLTKRKRQLQTTNNKEQITKEDTVIPQKRC